MVPLSRVTPATVDVLNALLNDEAPIWGLLVVKHPVVELQDGPEKWDMVAREVFGVEKAEWWQRAVEAYPDYANYQLKTKREIPVFVLERLPEPAE